MNNVRRRGRRARARTRSTRGEPTGRFGSRPIRRVARVRSRDAARPTVAQPTRTSRSRPVRPSRSRRSSRTERRARRRGCSSARPPRPSVWCRPGASRSDCGSFRSLSWRRRCRSPGSSFTSRSTTAATRTQASSSAGRATHVLRGRLSEVGVSARRGAAVRARGVARRRYDPDRERARDDPVPGRARRVRLGDLESGTRRGSRRSWGLWPANAFYWEFKYDVVPAALLAVGLVLAWRERWALSGIVLGIGTLVKWTPALAVVAFVVWLVAGRRFRLAAMHCAGRGGNGRNRLSPVSRLESERGGGRVLAPERPQDHARVRRYLLLRPFDLAHVRTHISFRPAPRAGRTPRPWPSRCSRCSSCSPRPRGRGAASAQRPSLAACAPAVFLLTNRIFSLQFVVVLFAAWATAAALVVRTRRE